MVSQEIWALIGMGSGVIITASFFLWFLRGEGKTMACPKHGECPGCRLDEAEDVARQIDAKQEPLWAAVNDFGPQISTARAHMRTYVDEQLNKVNDTLEKQAAILRSLQELKR